MALQPWISVNVVSIKDESQDTRRFLIEVPDMPSFDFKPGQFVTFDLPIHEKINKRLRSYSIASAPDGTNKIELVIVLDKKGSGTNYLFTEVTEGSTLVMRGPQGVFTMKEPLEEYVFMICTGTGIAPFRSMINHIFNTGVSHKNLYLVFGCRTKADLLYYSEFSELQQKHPGFRYIPTLSRENWEGETGYVHNIYEQLCASKPSAEFYLCGWKGMIDEARERIQAMGYDKKAIHFEIYG